MSNGGSVCGPISSYSRVRILHLLFEAGASGVSRHLTVAELCAATGLHANTVREHLQRLIEGGYVIPEVERRTTRGRPRTLYRAATGASDASSPVARDKAKAAARRGDLLRSVVPSAAVSTLGRDAVHQLDALVEHLEESGFEPVVDDRVLTVDLSPCPHAAGRPEDRPLLCQVHLGLMQSVLTEAGGPLAAACVRDAESPSECTVQLRDTTTQQSDRTGVAHGMA
ncbi:helix-turn-helix domain-containing protein [Microbacterium paraoxydans]|uniref:ArsR family transcriptional regulator n=1 Tax=Microbacterium paraoxydans TaxID=199592 RepID=A0ABS5IM19_9MICO|nr:helix-turn-helix domain-containing protein [Microbacterium paraoxydans]MBS0024001.1 ArsR family transcriptional regulator [Microbacterium paraoxydans]